jgi:arginase
LNVSWETTLRAKADGDALAAVRDLSVRLARRVHVATATSRFPLVLGGDHSVAIGTWSGAAAAMRPHGPFGLIWIDAHMDAHLPHTSPSGNLHGMPLACLLGYGDERLVSVCGAPALRPEHVCLVGVRSFEEGEAALLDRLGVRIFFMEEVERRGLSAVMRDAQAIVTWGTAAVGLTLDLDALDPEDAPGVGTPEPGGIRARDLLPELTVLGQSSRLAAAEIVEYDPRHDRGDRTARLVESIAKATFGAPWERDAGEERERLAA